MLPTALGVVLALPQAAPITSGLFVHS